MGGGSRWWFKLGVVFLGDGWWLMVSQLGSISELLSAVYISSLSIRTGLRSGSFHLHDVCFLWAMSTGKGEALSWSGMVSTEASRWVSMVNRGVESLIVVMCLCFSFRFAVFFVYLCIL